VLLTPVAAVVGLGWRGDEWSPWPWLAVGVILFVFGVAAFIDRQRRASHRS
jgi:drug/metabolite transporter (DMT)-like permease